MAKTENHNRSRWNGWGDPAVEVSLASGVRDYLGKKPGRLEPGDCASLDNLLAAVPATRLPVHPAVSTDPEDRARHARGQSLPDWVCLRFGRVTTFPDGVAYPAGPDQITELIAFAKKAGAVLIPYGGGTSVVGHINPPDGDRPVLTLDLRGMARLLAFEPLSRLATLEAGASGPLIENRLAEHGHTLGHFPQSFGHSTLGGWIATRSSGQQSLYYRRIEDIVASARLETSLGGLDFPSFPASAAGPDLRQMGAPSAISTGSAAITLPTW